MLRPHRLCPVVGLLLGLLITSPSFAQAPLDPGVRPVTQTFAITNARVVQAPGRVLDRATVVIRDGLIEAVGPNVQPPFDAHVIEGDTLVVYAGFIDALGQAAVQLPTADQERVRDPGNPPRDRAGLLPDRLTHTLLNPEDSAVEALRRAGFTVAHVAPPSGMLSGQSTVILLAGDRPEDMVLVPEAALVARFDGGQGVYPATPMAVMASLRQHVRQARRAADAEAQLAQNPVGLRRPAFDPVATGLRRAVQGDQTIFFVAENVLEGHRALRLAEELDLRVVVAGIPETTMLTDQLRARNVRVLAPLALPDALPADTVAADTVAADTLLATPTRDLARHVHGEFFITDRRTRSYRDVVAETEDLQERRRISVGLYERNPLALQEAGIPFAFATLDVTPGDIRENLRRMIAAGLTPDAALTALTTAPAEALGLTRQLGTVEAGKIANLVVVNGDYFAEDTRVRYVFVDGRRFEIDADTPRAEEDPDAEVTVVGSWDASLVMPEGALAGRLTFTGSPDALSGTFQSPEVGRFTLEAVRVSGNRLTFAIPNTPLGRVEATGIVAGDTIEGEMTAPGAPPISFSATRRPN